MVQKMRDPGNEVGARTSLTLPVYCGTTSLTLLVYYGTTSLTLTVYYGTTTSML